MYLSKCVGLCISCPVCVCVCVTSNIQIKASQAMCCIIILLEWTCSSCINLTHPPHISRVCVFVVLRLYNRQLRKSLFIHSPALKQQLEMSTLFTSIKTTNKQSLNFLYAQFKGTQIFGLLKHEGRAGSWIKLS